MHPYDVIVKKNQGGLASWFYRVFELVVVDKMKSNEKRRSMEKKEGNMICEKCGTSNDNMTKFCGNCGSLAGPSEEEPSKEQAQEQTPEQAIEPSEKQAQEQTPEQGEEPSEEQAQEQTPEQAAEPSEEPSTEQTPEQQTPNKKKLRIIGAVAAALILVIIGIVALSGSSVEGRMRNQLRGLDSTSYSDIVEWVDNDFVEYFEDYFDLSIMATDQSERNLGDRFLDNEDRFIEWSFLIDEEEGVLFIEVMYEEVDLALLVSELEGLDNHSLSDILDWKGRAESEYGSQVHLVTRVISVDGNPLNIEIDKVENEEFFVEWKFDVHEADLVTVEIDVVFNMVRTFHFGEPFELDGLEIAFEGDIVWDIDSDESSSSFGEEYFKVPVIFVGLSRDNYNTENSFFTPKVTSPDGTQIGSLELPDAFDDITRMNEGVFIALGKGYIYIQFYEDGDYVIELQEGSATIEIIIPIDSEELRGQAEPLTPVPPITLEEIADETAMFLHIFEENFHDMITMEIEAYGENELIITYIYFETVPAGNAHLVNDLMEEIVESMMVFYGVTGYRVMIELGLDSAIITSVFVDRAGTEFFRDSMEFPLQ